MAGIAPQHRGGSNATTIGMAISIFVSVLLLGVLIWLFTMQEQLRNDADLAQKARDRSGNELREMKKTSQLLIGGLTGNQNDVSDAAVTQLDTVREEIASDSRIPREARNDMSSGYGAVAIIRKLHELYGDENQALKKKEESLKRTKAALDKSLATNQKLEDEFGGKTKEYQDKYEELQQGKKNYETGKNESYGALEQQLVGMREELNQKEQDWAKLRRRYRLKLGEFQRLLDEQAVVIRDLRGPTSIEARPLALARKPVGEVLRAFPGHSLVHINLGREDRVTHGMTFSVYSGSERVPESGRGKASIEVVSVGQRTAECRVVTPPAPGDSISEGDQVGNIVLSRNRSKQQRFCVVGEFDVDFDGRVDRFGRKTIMSLIERWGGVVVDDVDAMTDYVVVGRQPPGEAAIPSDLIDEEEVAEEDDEEYDDEEDEDEEDDEEYDDEEDEYEEDDEEFDDEEDEDEEDGEEFDDEEDEDEDEEDDEEFDDEDEDDEEEDDGDNFDPGPGGPGADDGLAANIPRRPEVDPTRQAQKRRFRSEGERYRDALLRARYFSVPVLRQEQFFNFIGIEGTVSDVRRLRG